MAISSYVGAEIDPNVNTFENWLDLVNDIVGDMGTSVVSIGDNNIGNTSIEGTFSANTVFVGDQLSGGVVGAPTTFSITSDVTFSGVDVTFSTQNTLTHSGDVTLNGPTKSLVVDNANTTILSTNFQIETDVNITGDIQAANASFSSVNISNDLNVVSITAEDIVANTVTATTFDTTSDRRLKENIEDVTDGIEKVSQLQGVYYNLKGTDDRNLGLIAQDVEKIIPEVVKTDTAGYKSVSYGNVVAVLIEAIKDLQQQIDELKKP